MKLLLISLFLSLAGCSTPQLTTGYKSSPVAAHKALVYVYRSSSAIDSANPDLPRMYINDQKLGKLRLGGYYVLEVDPGETVVYYKDSLFGIPFPWRSQEIHFTTVSGQKYFVKYVVDISLFSGRTILFTQVEKFEGESEIRSTQLLKD